MSSRTDHRRRERSWEREDRDRDRDRERDKDRYSRSSRTGGHQDSGRRRDSRSRSPRRDRRDYDKDHKGSRRDDRRDYDRDRERDDLRPGRPDDRRTERKPDRRDERRDQYTPDRGIPRGKDIRDREPAHFAEPQRPREGRADGQPAERPPKQTVSASTPSEPIPDPDNVVEEGEEMDVTLPEDEDMMATMGLKGFGSTKGKHVEGNQEGTTNVKKMRTWRQYMNRRGGFNRPLDKIK